MENNKPQTFKKVKAILIEPEKGRISEIEISGGFPAFYEIIGCNLIESHRSVWQTPNNSEMMYFDEEGRLKKLQWGFQHSLLTVDQFNLPFLGNCLIVGRDWNTGEDIDTQLSLDYLKSHIRFYKLEL